VRVLAYTLLDSLALASLVRNRLGLKPFFDDPPTRLSEQCVGHPLGIAVFRDTQNDSPKSGEPQVVVVSEVGFEPTRGKPLTRPSSHGGG